MKQFWIEGLLSPRSGSGRVKNVGVKPYSQSFWANSAQEAVNMALQANPGSRWIEGPTVGETSEEQRMRAMGAPELPGLDARPAVKKSRKK
jgi:hypothetical protein